MKNIFIIILALASLAVFSVSCDKVEMPYTEEGGGGETDSDTIRKLLMEDYTGHQCIYCPSAGLILDNLHEHYGDRMIVVTTHTGTLADQSFPPYGADYKSTDGEVLAAFFGANTAPLPRGIVNRTEVNGTYLIERGEFATEVSRVLDSMDQRPDLYLEIIPNYVSGNTFDVDVKITAMKDMPAGKYNLSILITESNIISAQKNQDPAINNGQEILEYNHKHMMRASVNTPWGEEFATSISKGEIFNIPYTNVELDAGWVADNISIVAFAYYADGPNEKEVIQAQTESLK